jgi:hypothetical protein
MMGRLMVSIFLVAVCLIVVLGHTTSHEPQTAAVAITLGGAACSQSEDIECYAKLAKTILLTHPLDTVLSDLESVEHSDALFEDCHGFAHYLGREAYAITPDIPVLFKNDAGVCHGGFYHGVIEAYFQSRYPGGIFETNEETLLTDIASTCGMMSDYQIHALYGECIHGVGHALMLITEADLPRSLLYCDVYPPTLRDTCYGGVIMQNSWGLSEQGHQTEYLRPEEPLYPCTTLGEEYRASCYAYQAYYFKELTEGNWGEMMGLCNQAPKEYQRGCYVVIGLMIVEQEHKIETYGSLCALSESSENEDGCVQGIVTSLGGRYRGDPAPMMRFCEEVGASHHVTCAMGIGATVATWSTIKSEAEGICDLQRDPALRTYCMRGINLLHERINTLSSDAN